MRIRRPKVVSALAIGLVTLGAAAAVRAIDSDGDGVDDAFDVCNNTPPGTTTDTQGRPLGDMDQAQEYLAQAQVLFEQLKFTQADEVRALLAEWQEDPGSSGS